MITNNVTARKTREIMSNMNPERQMLLAFADKADV